MTKQDLITVVGSKTGQNDSHVRPIIEATLDAIKECVQRKEPVYLRGFGTFQPKKRAEKKARNITAGTTIIVPAPTSNQVKVSQSTSKKVWTKTKK